MPDVTTPIRETDRASTLIRRVVRASIDRPVAARRAAGQLRQGFPTAVAAEIRWAFTPPRSWLSGVTVNLVLSLVWLAVQPVEHEGHRDWVLLVAMYFSSFILADVTTTNMLGVDNLRVEESLRDGVPLWRLLLVKNAALGVIVGVPTMLLAVGLTLLLETPANLIATVPDVAVPLLCWLGVGNIVSVLVAVGYEPLIRRWRQRDDRRCTLRWLAHLALPYALYYLADPVYGLPQHLIWDGLPAVLGPMLGPGAGRPLIHVGFAAVVWVCGLVGADAITRKRGLRVM
jgi:hypothetical protein